jgi:hypothetical protein
MSHTISSSELKRQLGAWLAWIGRTREDVIIETYGRPVAVLLAYDEYADFLACRQGRGGEPGRLADHRRPAPPALANPGAGGLKVVLGSARREA